LIHPGRANTARLHGSIDHLMRLVTNFTTFDFVFVSFGRFVILFELCMNACARRSLVWGHFCLCYEGEKLIDDKAYIRVVGIKDGDQV